MMIIIMIIIIIIIIIMRRRPGPQSCVSVSMGGRSAKARAAGGVGSSKNAQLWLFKIIIIINNWVTCSSC